MSDRYLKAVLTVIALELLWIGVKDLGTPVAAQATPPAAAQPAAPAPMAVVIRGVEIDNPTRGAVPMFSAIPLAVEVSSPVKIQADEPIAIISGSPLKVEAERPLPVENVPFTPAKRPGE